MIILVSKSNQHKLLKIKIIYYILKYKILKFIFLLDPKINTINSLFH